MPVEDFCKGLHSFFTAHDIKHKLYKISGNACFVELNNFKAGLPFVSPTLEEIKTSLKALSASLFAGMNYGALSPFKSSLYFYIDKGASWFKDLQPGSFEWVQAEESFECEGEYAEITNDKNKLFFSGYGDDFANCLDFEIAAGKDGELVEEVKRIDFKACNLLQEPPKPVKEPPLDFAGGDIPF